MFVYNDNNYVLVKEPTLKDKSLRLEVQELMKAAERFGCGTPEGKVKLHKTIDEFLISNC